MAAPQSRSGHRRISSYQLTVDLLRELGAARAGDIERFLQRLESSEKSASIQTRINLYETLSTSDPADLFTNPDTPVKVLTFKGNPKSPVKLPVIEYKPNTAVKLAKAESKPSTPVKAAISESKPDAPLTPPDSKSRRKLRFTMASIDRATITANNKSLRVIKNELEALLERNFISDDQYNNIIDSLPAEQSLRGASTASASRNSAASSTPPVGGFAALNLNQDRANATSPAPSNPPPSYSNTPTPHSQAPPPPPPPAAPPQHHEVAHAVAMYRYSDPDSRDLNLEVGDHVSVKEFVNDDWWMGINVRTREEGIFPKNYVRKEDFPSALVTSPAPPHPGPGSNNGYFGGDSKGVPTYGGPPQQQQQPMGGYYQGQQPPPPGPSDPYAGPVPPMAMANQPDDQQQQHGPNKVGEMGKKFGKKLGNAAIFGAGATLGADLVNSIF